jgi:hypothetical protein
MVKKKLCDDEETEPFRMKTMEKARTLFDSRSARRGNGIARVFTFHILHLSLCLSQMCDGME